MNITFEPASFKHLPAIYNLLKSDFIDDTAYTAVSILGWQRYFAPRLSVNDDFILYSVDYDGERHYIAPLVSAQDKFVAAVSALESIGAKKMEMVNGWQADILSARGYRIEEDRDMAEYIYLSSDLINLEGKRFHAKRNFINGFGAPYVFRDYEKDDYDEVVNLFRKWNADRAETNSSKLPNTWEAAISAAGKTEFDLELDIFTEVLSHGEQYKAFTDVMTIDDKIIGVSMGEIMPCGVGAIYFQKADTSYRGVYQILDNLFAKKRFSEIKYVNKQEDMGIAGLRRAKESYCPVKFADRLVAYREDYHA